LALKAGSSSHKEKDSINPYDELYIYYVHGRVRDEDEMSFGAHFLGNWVEDNSSFLFFSIPSRNVVSEFLKKQTDLEFIDQFRFTYEQWQGGGSTPFRIENLHVTPPWEEREIDEKDIKIIIDPGVVFGTGHHPTTRDCLSALTYLQKGCSIGRVLDLGTGTGILALASVVLGAKKVMAVDLNPLAVKTAKKNIHLNGYEEKIEVLEGKAEDFVTEPADLLVANIHYDVVAKLLESSSIREKRWFIISGLLRSQARTLGSKLETYGLRLVREWDHEMTWHTLLLENKCLK